MEDRIVQASVARILSAVYEPLFQEQSYGFRPRRSAHDALRQVDVCQDRADWATLQWRDNCKARILGKDLANRYRQRKKEEPEVRSQEAIEEYLRSIS